MSTPHPRSTGGRLRSRLPSTSLLIRGFALLVAAALVLPAQLPLRDALAADKGSWASRAAAPSKRQEVSYVALNGKIHLLGHSQVHHVYDPQTNSWAKKADLPIKLHHVQAVAVGGKIYMIGGLTTWPDGDLDTVYIYDPGADKWTQGARMPKGRGAGGVAVRNGKIYYAGGLNNGVAVPWFDVYDPAANTWTALPSMPRAREHFHAAVVNGKLWAVGGRNVAINNTIGPTDAFNFSTNKWQTGFAPIPTQRGGFAVGVSGDELIVFGGEGGGKAHPAVEAYDTKQDRWRDLTPMATPRHGIQAAEVNGRFYIATGATAQGGGKASTVHDVFTPPGGGSSPSPSPSPSPGPNDADGDGIPDSRDRFALDPDNGTTTTLPVRRTWEADEGPRGGILGTGFTGVMTDLTTDFAQLYEASKVTIGGTPGVLTVTEVPPGDAWRKRNSQRYGFQLGVRAPRRAFTVRARIWAPFEGTTPAGQQSMGVFIGNGTQRDYAKLVVHANGGDGGIRFVKEVHDTIRTQRTRAASLPGPRWVDLFLVVDPRTDTVKPMYRLRRGNGTTTSLRSVGTAVPIPSAWLGKRQGLAVGLIATSRGSGEPFAAAWDLLSVTRGRPG